MADDASSAADEAPITFSVKSSSDAKYTITIPLSSTVLQLKERLATKDYADLPAERQRLIYSGRVLKDADSLATYNIKAGNTVHLVKSAASNVRQNPANQGSGAGSTPAVPQNLATGTGNNPLAGLTGARYAGFAQLPNQNMFGPDGGMGPPPDPEQMIQAMQNPQVAQALNEALANPQIIDHMIQSNPMLRGMGPQVRQMMQSPEFRRMMTDPEQLRQMSQMQRMFGGAGGMGGMGGFGGGAQQAFPAPGATDTTPAGAQQTREGEHGGGQQGAGVGQNMPFNPFMAMMGGGFGGQQQQQQPGSNPFSAFLNPQQAFAQARTPAASPPPPASAGQSTPNTENPPAAPSTTTTSTTNTSSTAQEPSRQPLNPTPFNPFAMNPQAIEQMMAAMNAGNNGAGAGAFGQWPGAGSDPNAAGGAGGAADNPFAAYMNAMLGSGGAPPFNGGGMPQNPPDTRPPEERYAEQLRQLNDMGFYEFERNVEALRRTGGSVQGAVEYLLTH